MPAKEQKLWADGEALDVALDKISQRLLDDPAVQARLISRRGKLQPSGGGLFKVDYTQIDKRNIEILATDKLRRYLSRRTHIAYGVVERDEGSSVVRKIPSEFWPGAEIDAARGTATNGNQFYRRVRIAPPVEMASQNDGAAAHDDIPSGITHGQPPRAGRPSHGEKINAVIKSKVDANGPRWWDKSSMERYAGYRDALRVDYGLDGKKGLGEKTLQKYETAFKRLNH